MSRQDPSSHVEVSGEDSRREHARREHARRERIDTWLAGGGTVLASSERAARAVTSTYHSARQAEGHTAWLTPPIFSWESWVRDRWQERNPAGLMLLNPLQEQSLWAKAIGKSRAGEGLLHPLRLATVAQQAYRLLCEYSPTSLKASTRAGIRAAWTGDAAVFSEWVESFENQCRREGLISSSRLPLELAEAIQRESAMSPQNQNALPPLLLIGFDRLLPVQETLLNAWGEWRRDESGEAAQPAQFLAAPDAAAEVEACVRWLHSRLAADPEARLIVITTALQERRGELERALLDAPSPYASSPYMFSPDSSSPDASGTGSLNLDFEFSLGVPLERVSLVRAAILLMRWLHEPLSEPELDWLLSSGHSASNPEEEIALAETMRELRRRGQERPQWRIDDFAKAGAPEDWTAGGQPAGHRIASDRTGHASPPKAWLARILAARDRLRKTPQRQSPLDWVNTAGDMLQTLGWPGFRPLSSVSFQARERWDHVLEECGSLGFDNSQVEWSEFVSTVAEAVASTIFASESRDARVQITEPLESAGQLADGIWFLGAQEENWPDRGQPHPLLPIGLQRETAMPHASPQADWELAEVATLRLLASADEVIFSYARHAAEAEVRPSRLVARQVGEPEDFSRLSQGVSQGNGQHDLTETFQDASLIPFPHAEIAGGAAILTRQSLCPFQAFAMARMNAEDWEPAETGLTPKQRGQLLHSVLRAVWAGAAEGGISSLQELQQIAEPHSWVRRVVASVMKESFDAERRNSIPRRFPQRYLELEAERLTQLVSEWLEYERERLPFVVAETEARHEVVIAGLRLKLRLDRIDELGDIGDGPRLIIDYKSSEVGPKAWAGDRPDDVQLPLYAAFAVPGDLEGLVFARVRPGKTEFCGRVRDAARYLRQGLSRQNGLLKDPLTGEQLEQWRQRIERLARDFLAGKADVDPKEPGKTCESCHLHAVCRIYENQPLAVLEKGDEDSGGEDGTVENGENTGGRDA
jgi:ATP-dependent helicase/nuclease subunit B